MLALVTGVRLVLVRHAMPDVQPDVPAREWHLGEVRRPNAPSGQIHRALAAAYLGGAAHAGWEPQASVVRRFDAAVLRHLAIARHAAVADGRALVVGTHGMAMTLWLASRMPLHPDPPSFWAALRFPDVISVDSVDPPDRGR